MISKRVHPSDNDRPHGGIRDEIDRDDARRVADHDSRSGHDRHFAGERGAPHDMANGIDRRIERRDDARADRS